MTNFLNNSIAINARSKRTALEFNIKERESLLFIVDLLILHVSLFLYFKTAYPEMSSIQMMIGNMSGSFYGMTLFFVLSMIFNSYNLEYANKTRKIVPLVSFIGILFTVVYVFTPIITPEFPGRRLIVFSFVFGFTFFLVAWRVFYARVVHAPVFFKTVIVIVSNDFGSEFISEMRTKIEGDNRKNGYKINRVYSLPENEHEQELLGKLLERMVDRNLVSNLIILDSDHKNIGPGLNKTIIGAIQSGVDVQTYLNLYEELLEALPLNLAGQQFYSLFPISRHNSNYVYQLWNRSLDVFAAFSGLLVMGILIPFLALINRFVNKGPLFYSQPRVGKGGIEYQLTKFRSMVVDAEVTGAKMATKSDARITKFGQILRKTRMDELPQFWAVLKGDMSLIGPRPERMIFVNELAKDIPFYNARHLIKPGITGWAQVKYPYGENFQDSYNKLEYDLFYIKNRSVTIDLRIILKTVNSVIFSKGQ